MPRTVHIPASYSSVAIDVDDFVRFAAILRCDPLARPCHDTHYIAAGLLCYEDSRLRLTPRGEDLLASAHLIPNDPPPPKPERPKCGECKGRGSFPSFTRDIDCKACDGTGEASMLMFEDAVEKFDFTQRAVPFVPLVQPSGIPAGPIQIVFDSGKLNPDDAAVVRQLDEAQALFQRGVVSAEQARKALDAWVPEPAESDDGWTLIDSEETAWRFVGRYVEIDAPASAANNESKHHGTKGLLVHASHGYLTMRRGEQAAAILWSSRGNVRLRVVTEPNA